MTADFRAQAAAELERRWANDPRWAGVIRSYRGDDVVSLRGRVVEEHTLARRGAQRLWDLLHTEDYIHALGALTGNQAVQSVRAGLNARSRASQRGRHPRHLRRWPAQQPRCSDDTGGRSLPARCARRRNDVLGVRAVSAR